MSATTVASHILWLRRNIATTPMQLNKLVFLCHGWMLGNTGKPLFDDPIEAWPYGPVVPTVYHEYRVFQGDAIELDNPSSQSDDLGDYEVKLIEGVASKYRGYSAWQLSALTHRKGTPWQIERSHGRTTIPDKLIKKFYKERVRKIRAEKKDRN